MHGERLLTMSCSDKVARWNVVGLQGSLLTHIIEPIYLTTLIVGSLFHRDHLQRAVIGRVEHLQELPAPFRLTRPSLVTTSTPPARLPVKSPRHSVCWSVGWTEAEILDSSRGRLLDGSISRLSKMRLFEQFLRLVSLDSVWRTQIDDCVHNGFVSYGAVKAASKSFVEAREMLKQAFITAKLGHWIKKPLEQNYFELRALPTADTGDSVEKATEEDIGVRDTKPSDNI
jgi:double stranded RNA-specific editase B